MTQSSDAGTRSTMPRHFLLEMLMFTITVLAGLIILWSLFNHEDIWIPITAGCFFTFSLVMVIRLLLDPDYVRAGQTDSMLRLAGQTLACMQEGLTEKSAQKVCRLLLPSSAAIAVAITDTERILGYTGVEYETNPQGSIIQTQATYQALKDGKMRILNTSEDIGFPKEITSIGAAIIVPLAVGGRILGTLKYYYRRPSQISETQKSIAEGFGKLLSTQIAAAALEQQTKLATSMELKMLQSQINPHFLFNTINTIASLVRTDPAKARMLLREFAVFYRQTLEETADLVFLEREIEQTARYFSFEVARFGDDRLEMIVDIDPGTEEVLIPPFLIQPLVENAVRHALPFEGKLTIIVRAERKDDDILISIEDDGTGMTEKERNNILNPTSSKGGMGIAVKNINDRMKGFYGSESVMLVASEKGKGTTVTLVLRNAAVLEEDYQGDVDSYGEKLWKNREDKTPLTPPPVL